MKEVLTITREMVLPWIMKKHYAHRIPSISFAYGLYLDGDIIGVVTYGTPASSTLLSGVCGAEYSKNVIELNRLVIEENSPKNCASFLVGRSLRQLPKPKIVVSYADTGQGHVGYVYQACNFIYTGLSSKFKDPVIKGYEHQHHATYAHGMTNADLKKKYGKLLYFKERKRKHRYIYFVGCKELIEKLNYGIKSYPKGISKRYDSGGKVGKQQRFDL